MLASSAFSSGASGAAGVLALNPVVGIPQYSRLNSWGDKLLRKLNADQLKQYLAEQPYVSDQLQASQAKKHKKSKTKKPLLGRRKTLHSKLHSFSAKAAHSPEPNPPEQVMVTTDVSDDTYQRGKLWVVPGVGEFSNKAVYTFTGNTLPTGLTASDNEELRGTAPFPFRFDATNVTVANGTLNLKVPGGQDGHKRPISCAEVTTDETTILHASVRMTAKMSGQTGVCHGAFFYRSDQAESDIEYLTDPGSQSNRRNPDATQFWYSNQATSAGAAPSHNSAEPPPAVEGYHAYRLDWTPQFTAYYLDGKLQTKLTENIPDKSGVWVWNNWSNGDPGWSCGPPKNDSIFRIKDITMYYNTLNGQQ